MLQKQILIVTPYSEFGDIVSQSLGKEASCDVKVATSISEALIHIKKSKELDYALLDMDLGVEKVLEQGFTLRNAFPPISLILISKKNPPPEMEDLWPWKFLRKPFVQKELISLINGGSIPQKQDSDYIDLNFRSVAEDTVPNWYMDEVLATKNLVAAMSNLLVQEAILVSDTNVLAHSGDLPADAVEECYRLVRKYWGENNTAELIKPVRLKSTRKEHLLSATMVAVGIILALTFDAETPFDIMRSQTKYLTHVLKNPQLSMPDVHILPKNPDAQLDKRPTRSASPEFIQAASENIKPASRIPLTDLKSIKLERDQESAVSRQNSANINQYRDPVIEDRTGQSAPPAKEPVVVQDYESEREDPVQPKVVNDYAQTSFVIQDSRLVGSYSTSNPTGKVTRYTLDPIDPSMFDVYYACLLMPRIRTHVLDGDCAEFLRTEFPDIFLAYGWRLEQLIIDRSYVQWLVRIPPTIAPASHIKVIRKQSSQLILTNFTRFNRNEFLHDFWSPGFLLGCGRRLIPEAEITEFIQMNRQQYYPEADLHLKQSRESFDYR